MPKKDDLRVGYSTFAGARDLVGKLTAVLKRVQPVLLVAETAGEIEAALSRLTRGQRAVWAVEQLQVEMGNGGFEQYFCNPSGDTAEEALAGLRLIDAPKFAWPLERAMQLFPGGRVPRDRGGRELLLDQAGFAGRLTDSGADRDWKAAYSVEEELSKLALAYVERNPLEFFLDKP